MADGFLGSRCKAGLPAAEESWLPTLREGDRVRADRPSREIASDQADEGSCLVGGASPVTDWARIERNNQARTRAQNCSSGQWHWPANLRFPLAGRHGEIAAPRDDPQDRGGVVELPERFRNGGIDEGRRSLAIRWRRHRAGRGLVLPAARRAETQNQLTERRICMVDMRFIEGDQRVGQLARNSAEFIAVLLEMTGLCGLQVRRNGGAARIVEFLGA